MILSRKIKENFKFCVLGGLFIAACIVWVAIFAKADSGLLEVNFFDVGQGDAIFIEVPNGNQILIDGGPDDKILEKLSGEMPFWDRTIDMIILTHPEKDHVSGLLDVLRRYKVDKILWTGIVRGTPEYQEWQKLIKEEGAEIIIARAGQRIEIGENIFMDILSPLENLENKEIHDSNDTSIVSRLVVGSESFLFTGDIEKSSEYELIIRANSCSNSCPFATLDSDVLKVAHHGSKTSTSDFFASAVSPKIAVIQVGKNNRYGHPTNEVLNTLRSFDAQIFRNDIDGDIKILTDGNSLEIAQ